MKIVILNGSPKGTSGASLKIAQELTETLLTQAQAQKRTQAQTPGLDQGKNQQLKQIANLKATETDPAELVQQLTKAQALVLVFPLYVDSLPAHLLKLLEELAQQPPAFAPTAKLYAIINNGFWESRNNSTAFAVLQHFANQIHLTWGQGLGWGGGGMITMAGKIGCFPFKAFGRQLKIFSHTILTSNSGQDLYCQPDIPRFCYKTAANLMWYILAWKNKIKFKDLFQHP
jgi:hypothetical protein